MRVLITGGAGFIGSHLAETLLERGDEVYVLDNLSTGSIDNIAHLKPHPRFHYTIDTVTNEPLLAELIDVRRRRAPRGRRRRQADRRGAGPHHRDQRPRHRGGPQARQQEEEAGRHRVDIRGLRQERRRCRFHEDADLVLGPTHKHRWAYACSKMIDEFLALAYWKERKLPVIIVRLFNTVGPRQTGQYGMVIPNFVRQALAGQPITVFGDGTQSRSFTYVGDVVRAMVALIDEPRAVGEVFNIGNGTRSRSVSSQSASRRSAGSHRRSCGSHTIRPTKPASRTCRGACRTSPRSTRWSATRRPSSSKRFSPA